MRLRICAFALFYMMTGGSLPASADAPARTLSYQWTPGQTQRYKLTASIKGSLPLFESPTPVDLSAVVTLVYLATPKTLLADGTADVEFRVESAEVEIEKVPFPIPDEQVQSLLNQTVTFSKTGEVKKVIGGGELPFGVSIPGVDPKRLYALLFPVVFQEQPVKPGDRWSFKSELLGGGGTRPSFTATALPMADGAVLVPLREEFSMEINQSVDAEKKPVTGKAKIHRTQTGRITGEGALQFDAAQGRFTRSEVKIVANITDRLVGKPLTKDEPKQIITKVNAKVTVDLQPAPNGPRESAPTEKKEKP